MTPVHLTPKIVAEAALAAHAGKTLCAQNIAERNPSKPINFYRSNDKPGVACAVGAALPDDVALKAVYPASDTPPDVMVLSDPKAIDRIQELHDSWTLAIYDKQANAAEAEQRFLDECRKHIPAPV